MNPTNEVKNKRRLTFKFWSRERDLKILKFVAILFIIAASLITIKDEILWQIDSFLSAGGNQTEIYADQDAEENNCNVMGIELHGILMTYISPADLDQDGNPLEDQSASEDIVYWIQQAEQDDQAKAIILEIDSYGGGPTAGEKVGNALKQA